jgi:hypothetical protein
LIVQNLDQFSTGNLKIDMTRTFWLPEEILSWHAEYESGHRTEIERVLRPHELLLHSEGLLTSTENEFARADAVLSLKRAINSRLQHLEELYAFSTAFPRNIGALERLEIVGLARPLLIRQLFSLRNNIEHNDATPPNAYECRELIDSTWYFLKTTDYACKVVPRGVVLKNPSRCTGSSLRELVTVSISLSTDEVAFQGILSNETISWTKKAEHFCVNAIEAENQVLVDAIIAHKRLTDPNYRDFGDLGFQRIYGKASVLPRIKHVLWRRMLETL